MLKGNAPPPPHSHPPSPRPGTGIHWYLLGPDFGADGAAASLQGQRCRERKHEAAKKHRRIYDVTLVPRQPVQIHWWHVKLFNQWFYCCAQTWFLVFSWNVVNTSQHQFPEWNQRKEVELLLSFMILFIQTEVFCSFYCL